MELGQFGREDGVFCFFLVVWLLRFFVEVKEVGGF